METRTGREGTSGFTYVEVMISVAILSMALLGLLATILNVSRMNAVLREDILAMRAAEKVVETMRGTEFAKIFATFNGTPGDDPPPGPGTAAGPHFDVEGLIPKRDDADGKCGRIFFPTLPEDVDGVELREDVTIPETLLPRDLDGDGVIGSASVAGTYKILPVGIRVEWTGIRGPTTWTYRTMILGRR
jgi:type II secretory pathway pseudopilin PulG